MLFKFTIHCSEYILVMFRNSFNRFRAIYNAQRESIWHTNTPYSIKTTLFSYHNAHITPTNTRYP